MTARADERDGGFALVAVLGFLLLTAAIVAPFAITARTTLLIDSRHVEQQKLALLADGLSFVLAARVEQGAFGARLAQGGVRSCADGRLVYTLRLQDQAGLVDLNAASAEMLADGLAVVGLGRTEAMETADAIERFRGVATSEDRMAVAPDGGWKSAPFESVSELHDFAALRGIAPGALHSVFTVHSGRGAVLIGEAPPRLAAALGAAGLERGEGTAGAARSVAISLAIAQRDGELAAASGFIVRLPDTPEAPIERLEPLPADFSGSGAPVATGACTTIFGRAWASLRGPAT